MSDFIFQYYVWLSGLNAWLSPVVSNAVASLNVPLLSALLFGLLGATAPCQLSTSVATLAFLGRQADDPHRMWAQTLAFVAGKAMVYAVIGGALVLAGFSFSQLSGTVIPIAVFARRAMGPLLIGVGLVMVGLLRVPFRWSNQLAQWIETKVGRRADWLSAFALGVAFSFTFCPTLALLFFGLTLPLAIASPGGVLFPGVFAFGTTLPIVLLSALFASGVIGMRPLLQRLRSINVWVQRFAGLIFILVGVNELVLYWLI